MKTFFLFAFPFFFAGNALLAQTTQVLNSAVRAEILLYEFSTSADGDTDDEDDPAMLIMPSLSSVPTPQWTELCITWQCDAPCTYPWPVAWYGSGIPFEETLSIHLLAYESDNTPSCTWAASDDFTWEGNAAPDYDRIVAPSPVIFYIRPQKRSPVEA